MVFPWNKKDKKLIDSLIEENMLLQNENKFLKESLNIIKEFGFTYSGKGYSCATIAKEALDTLEQGDLNDSTN